MTTGISELTAAPSEVEVNGKNLKLYPLRFRNWGEIERWIRDDIVSRAKRTIIDATLTASQRESIMSAAFKSAGEVNVIDQTTVVKTYLTTFEGMLRVIVQSVGNGEKNENLRLTINDLDELFNGNIKLVTSVYIQVINTSYPAPKKDGQPVNPIPLNP